MWAAAHDNFWGTFNVKSFFITVTSCNVFKDSWHSFSLRREWKTNFLLSQMFFLKTLEVAANSFKQFCHSSVSCTWLLSWITSNSMLKLHGMNVVWEVISPFEWTHSSVRILILRTCVVFSSPDFYNFHLVQRKGACFVGADVVGTTHNFAWRKTLNIVVVLKHTGDWISKWDHDSKR